ncbi:serine threonine kinase [Fusarium circinatum]|uniref:Serine threonine kinase n=1 Tax=Fusarium circinatum TaxID=48490 RepID=A0A8H5WPI7_FUSCI|nr:serine threonine kinase [Fusarium circinatum]
MSELSSNHLRSDLKSSLIPAKDGSRRSFLPAGAINHICKRATVYEQLLRYYIDSEAVEFIDYVCNTRKPAREVFCILVLIDKKQWSVHVPVFNFGISEEQGQVYYRFDKETIMPWLSLDKKVETGGYATVERLEIHPGHCRSTRHNTFALKILRSDIEDIRAAFRQELTAFRRLRRGPHLIELVAAVELAECQFMFIFPWAEGGTLEDLMNQEHANRAGTVSLLSREFILWVLDQCRGLVEALETIHFTRTDSIYQSDGDLGKDYGLHLDIKPSNILYFSQETEASPFGTLKLADCGLVEFHSLASRSRKSKTGCSAGSQTYRPPEYDFNHTKSKKVDVWAMGCVFSELLTWAILPHGSVNEYRLARTQDPSVTRATGGENDKNYECNFFQHHIQLEATGEATISVSKLTTETDRLSLQVRGRQVNSNTRRVECHELCQVEVPKLKPSVLQVQHEMGLGVVAKFLAFLEEEMMHPERVQRADCQRVIEFFAEHVDKAVNRSKESSS